MDMAKKVTTIAVFPEDKKPFKEMTRHLLEFGDTEPVLFHKMLEDYAKMTKQANKLPNQKKRAK